MCPTFYTKQRCNESKEEGKDLELFNQVPHLTQAIVRKRDKNTRKRQIHESQDVSPFQTDDHKVARNMHAIMAKTKTNNKLEFRESDVSSGKTEVKQGKFVKFISPVKVFLRETYKSQNINPISPTPKFTLVIKQIKVKSL